MAATGIERQQARRCTGSAQGPRAAGAGKITELDRAAVRRRRQPATLRAEGCGCQYAAISGDRSLTPQAIALPKCATTATFAAKEPLAARSEEPTSELQSLMRISYAVFCL